MAEPEKPKEAPSAMQFVTELTPISQQVGANILRALQEGGTVAVLSTIVPGVPTDRVVSMPLSNEQLAGVQGILSQIQATTEAPKETEDPNCIGFHCHLPSNKG